MSSYDHEFMFKDLQGKRLVGDLYRRFFLYPKLKKNITGKLVDIGAGLGDFCISYKNSVALDINKYAVKHCQERLIESKLILNNEIDYENNTFDSAIMDNVLEHILEPRQLLSEVYRVLKSKGRFIVGVPGIKGYKSDFDHKVFYDDVKLIKLLDSHDFNLVKKFYTPFKSKFFNDNLKIYCLYCIFEKSRQGK